MRTKRIYALTLLVSLLGASGCASFQAGNDIAAGRLDYLIQSNETALSHFQSAVRADPTYTFGAALPQNALSYLGRTEYLTGRLPQARQTLEKALTTNTDPNMVRLYLGLTLARSGDQQQGLKEIEGGMRGLYDWLNYFTEAFRFNYGKFWDPRYEIRSAIQTQLATLRGKDIQWPQLLADGEWLGRRMEQEIDWAQRDQLDEYFVNGALGNQ
jgi:tetratricopeptide (TPR) repeat protein